MGAVSPLYATLTPTPFQIPIADGGGLLDAWVTPGLTNPMTTDQDIIVGGFGGSPTRLGVGLVGYVLTVGSGGIIDWAAPTGGFTNPMTTFGDLIVGGISGAAGRLGIGSVGQVLTVGSGGVVDWETPAVSGGTVTTVSVVSANGLAGSVANPTTTPAITLSTTITGILKGNGTAISAATTTGTGDVVLATSPTLITPNIGAATGTSLAVTGTFTSGAVAGTTGALLLKGLTSGTFTMSVNDAAGTWTAKWPATAGSNTNVLATDGSGNLFWQSTGTGTVTAGTATQFAYYPASTNSVSSTPTLTVSSAGRLAMTPTLISGASTPYLTITAPADVLIPSGVESIGVRFVAATRQHDTNTTVVNQREYVFEAPTYSSNLSTMGITNGATLAITGAPVSGLATSITNAMALWIQAGRAILGTPASVAATGILGTYGTTSAETDIFARTSNAATATGTQLLFSHSRGSLASPTATQSGDVIGRVAAGGYGSAWVENTATITFLTTQNYSGSALGSRIVLATTPNSSTTLTDVLRIDQDGSVNALVSVTASSTTTGSIVAAGGLGVGGNVYMGGATLAMTNGGSGTSGIFGSSGLLDIRSQGGLNISPSTSTGGIMSVAGGAQDIVLSDSTSTRAFQAAGASPAGRGFFIQRAGASCSVALLTVGTGNDNTFNSAICNGSYGSLTATETGRRTRIQHQTYGGTTWVSSAQIFLVNTQAHTESARGTQIAFNTTPNGSTTIANVLMLDQDASALFAGVAAFKGAAISSSTAVNLPAATTALSSLRLAHGAAPSSPVNGDIWTTTAGLFVRINGVTVGPLS